MYFSAGKLGRTGLLLGLLLALLLLSGRPIWAEAAVLCWLSLLFPLLALRVGDGSHPPARGWVCAGLVFAAFAVVQLLPLPPGVLGSFSPAAREALEKAYPGWPEATDTLVATRERLLTPIEEPAIPIDQQEELPLISVEQVLVEAGLRAPSGPQEAQSLPSAERLEAASLATPAWQPLTLTPWRTRGALYKLLILLCSFALAGSCLRAPNRAYPFAGFLVALGALVALVAVLQIFKHAPNPASLLGISLPDPSFETFGPFPNKNHLAGFLALLLPVAISLAISRIHPPPLRLVWVASAGLMSLGILAARSRGGIVAAAVGLGILSMGLLLRPGRRPWGMAILAGGVLALVAAWSVAPPRVAAGIEGLLETRPKEEIRWELWSDTLSLAGTHWATGSGLDSFRMAFPRYKTSQDPLYFTHAENDYLQLFAELGVAGLLLVALAAFLFGSGLCKSLRSAGTPTLALGAWAGVGAIAAHGTIDFNFHVTSNALATLLVVALAVGTTPRDHATQLRLGVIGKTVLLLAALLGTFATWIVQVPRGWAEWERSAAVRRESAAPFSESMQRIDRAARLDPFNPYVREEQGRLRRTASALDPRPESGWPRASLESSIQGLLQEPVRGSLHRNAGRLFFARRQWEDAELWFRKALYFDPQDAYSREFLGDALRMQDRLDEALEHYTRAAERLPSTKTHQAYQRILSKALEGTAEFDRLEGIVEAHPIRYLHLAEALFERGESDQVVRIIERLIEKDLREEDSLHHSWRIAARFKDLSLAEDLVEHWESVSPTSAGATRARAHLLEMSGNLDDAIRAARTAVQREPDNHHNYLYLADLLLRGDRLSEALETVRAGRKRLPENPGLRDREARLLQIRYRKHRWEIDRLLRGDR